MWVLLGFKKNLPSRNRDMLLFLFHHGKCIHMLPIVDEDKWGTQVSFKGGHNQNFRLVLLDEFELLKRVEQNF